jgi:nucleoside-diphosphate-sugar epimerase
MEETSSLENMEIKTILVTGDRGYIGAALVPKLLEKNYTVVGYDTNFYQTELDPPNEKRTYKQITKDIRKIEERDLQNIDAVIHLSALSNDPMGEINPTLTADINYHATMKLAQMAKKTGVKRFLFSSSCSIYGIAEDGVVDEKSKVNPLTAYAKSKIDTEVDLKKIADESFTVGLLRNSTVFGYSPKFRNDLVVNNLTTTALAYGQIRIMSDGSPWRPLIDVRDLADFFVAFLEIEKTVINAKVINVGFSDSNFQVKDLVEEIKRQLPECETVFTGEHGADTRSYKVKFDLALSLFPDIKQQWPLEKSIKDLIQHLKAAQFNKQDFESGKYTRLSVLKKLLDENKIDTDLNWKNL